ncbi:MAG: acetyl-CoA carboxylase, carboxyltransferase subunit beta [Lachnospiraceae bacterium]|nr:acetyl-CoA carboxylase, carboxyltransferase subunit beta [Lachnospiraceae bacterium]
MSIFSKFAPIVKKASSKREVKIKPEGSDKKMIQCKTCDNIVEKDAITKYKICPSCGAHFRMNPSERVRVTFDKGTFEEFDGDLLPGNPMNFPDYKDVIRKAQDKAGYNEAVVTGIGQINGSKTVVAIMNSFFMMGSMGSVVGEKITRAFEYATAENLPIIVFSTSGGARMQEGIVSLMQMAKVSEAVGRHDDAGLLFISVLTDPTTGGVTASFAMLGDIILAEPNALIGFAGQRVIQSTIHQKLPAGFQRAEFQLDHGFVDKIVHRKELKNELSKILKLHGYRN